MKYHRCKYCGSKSFIRVYTVWNEEIQIQLDESDLWDIIEIGKEKDHLDGYICKKCRKPDDELNDSL